MSRETAYALPEIAGQSRVAIENVSPQVDCGRFPIKRVVGDSVVVEADIFGDGHDVIAGALHYRLGEAGEWLRSSMRPLVNDRWTGEFPIEQIGNYQYKVVGWVDRFGTWKRDLAKRIAAGQDVGVELLIAADLVHAASERAQGRDREQLAEWDRRLRGDRSRQQPREVCDSEELSSLMARWHQPVATSESRGADGYR